MTQVVTMFEPVATTNSVTCQARIGEQLPLADRDWDKLYQVLTTLRENALKFTEPGGRSTLTHVCRRGVGSSCVSGIRAAE